MTIWNKRSKRKATGGRYHKSSKKKARHISRDPVLTRIAKKTKAKFIRTRGGRKKNSLIGAKEINLIIKGKAKKTTMSRVIKNPASRYFVRQNVVSKGAIVETPKGLARVTSRPTQDGVVNAVLVKKK